MNDLVMAAVHHFAEHSPKDWWLHIQTAVEGVSCPEEWKKKYPLLPLKLNVEVPTVTDQGLTVSVLFHGVWTPCYFPWASVGAVSDLRGAGVRRGSVGEGVSAWVPFITETESPFLPGEGDGLDLGQRFLWAVSTPVERRRMFITLVTPNPESTPA
jgi:hypothetical protein